MIKLSCIVVMAATIAQSAPWVKGYVVGFYEPAFRKLWYSRPPFRSIFDAVVSVLAGNWRPSIATRALVEVFFAVVAVERVLLKLRRGSNG